MPDYKDLCAQVIVPVGLATVARLEHNLAGSLTMPRIEPIPDSASFGIWCTVQVYQIVAQRYSTYISVRPGRRINWSLINDGVNFPTPLEALLHGVRYLAQFDDFAEIPQVREMVRIPKED